MAIIVKGEITISKGFNHWKEMILSQTVSYTHLTLPTILRV